MKLVWCLKSPQGHLLLLWLVEAEMLPLCLQDGIPMTLLLPSFQLSLSVILDDWLFCIHQSCSRLPLNKVLSCLHHFLYYWASLSITRHVIRNRDLPEAIHRGESAQQQVQNKMLKVDVCFWSWWNMNQWQGLIIVRLLKLSGSMVAILTASGLLKTVNHLLEVF